MLKPDAVSSFSYVLPSKQRKTSDAQNALAMHCDDIISKLLSAGSPSDIRD